MRFSKVISYGNGCDLNAVDCLKYLGSDSKTRIIGAYLEGIASGRPFFELAREISKRKPIVIWKGGQTRQGEQTLVSHTGSIGGSYDLWEAALRQVGVLVVRDFEELLDTLFACSKIPYIGGKRIAITTGLIGGGGGISVEGTDIAVQEGLELVGFSPKIQERFAQCLPRKAGTILSNPIDFGSAQDLAVMEKVLRLVITETDIDIILIQEFFDRMLGLAREDLLVSFFNQLLKMGQKAQVPILLVWPYEDLTHEGFSLRLKLIEWGLTIFPSIRRASRAISNVYRYRTR